MFFLTKHRRKLVEQHRRELVEDVMKAYNDQLSGRKSFGDNLDKVRPVIHHFGFWDSPEAADSIIEKSLERGFIFWRGWQGIGSRLAGRKGRRLGSLEFLAHHSMKEDEVIFHINFFANLCDSRRMSYLGFEDEVSFAGVIPSIDGISSFYVKDFEGHGQGIIYIQYSRGSLEVTFSDYDDGFYSDYWLPAGEANLLDKPWVSELVPISVLPGQQTSHDLELSSLRETLREFTFDKDEMSVASSTNGFATSLEVFDCFPDSGAQIARKFEEYFTPKGLMFGAFPREGRLVFTSNLGSIYSPEFREFVCTSEKLKRVSDPKSSLSEREQIPMAFDRSDIAALLESVIDSHAPVSSSFGFEEAWELDNFDHLCVWLEDRLKKMDSGLALIPTTQHTFWVPDSLARKVRLASSS